MGEKKVGLGNMAFTAGLVGALLLPLGKADNAKADFIQVASQVGGAYAPYFGSYAGAIDSTTHSDIATPGYDAGVDILADTSTNPYDWATVVYSTLDGHDVGLNYSSEPQLTDSYTMRLSVDTTGVDVSNASNWLSLTNFTVDNSNGISDYEYTLSVDTDANGVYDHFDSGLVSEVWASEDKKFGEWTQDLPAWVDWTNGTSYGELELTPIGVPEPTTIGMLVGAGLLAGAGNLATRKRRSKVRRRGRVETTARSPAV